MNNDQRDIHTLIASKQQKKNGNRIKHEIKCRAVDKGRTNKTKKHTHTLTCTHTERLTI